MPGGKENVWCDRGPRCRSRSPRKKPSRTALKSLSLDLDKSIINTTFDIDWPAHDLGHEGVHVAAKRNDEQTKREDDEDEGGVSS